MKVSPFAADVEPPDTGFESCLGGPWFQQYEPLPDHRRPGHRPWMRGFESP